MDGEIGSIQIDNVEIQIDGPEVPILNGSSKPFYDLLVQAGVQEQDAERQEVGPGGRENDQTEERADDLE